MNPVRVSLVCGVMLFSSGCFLGKKPVVQAPVAAPVTPSPAPVAAQQPVAATVPASVPASPARQPAAPATEPAKPSPFPPVITPPKPATVTPAPAPALGALLTADQRRRLDTAYQSDLRRANDVLDSLKARSLTPQQTDTVSRARAFIRQAAQFHDRDLTTAAELARRARVLMQDLAGALK